VGRRRACGDVDRRGSAWVEFESDARQRQAMVAQEQLDKYKSFLGELFEFVAGKS
jgi:hypothetical protein